MESRFLRNVDRHVRKYTAPYPREISLYEDRSEYLR
jgi:hypothetical protein